MRTTNPQLCCGFVDCWLWKKGAFFFQNMKVAHYTYFFIRGAALFFTYAAALLAAGNLVTPWAGVEMETYLTVDELAEYLKLNAQTIQRWVRGREIPFHKVKSVIRFRVSEIEKWVDEGGLVSQEEKLENNEAGLFDGDSSPDELGQLGETETGGKA